MLVTSEVCEKMEVGGLHVVEEILKGNLEGL